MCSDEQPGQIMNRQTWKVGSVIGMGGYRETRGGEQNNPVVKHES